MNTAPSNRAESAFTLVEMLVVIAIIALLAALLLPALTASQMRAKRITCESQLRQIGIAFQSFAHDHNGKFPMQVAASDGGSREFAPGGPVANAPFYFGFRNFQPLAGILQTPAVLICPADTRLPATNFAALQNSNISYFVSVTADYSRPMSILAGDGNLATTASLLRAAAGSRLTWTAAQHRFKGNVLFSDGHVEEWSDGGADTLASGGNFLLPSVAAGGTPLGQSAAAVSTGNAAASTTLGSGTTEVNSTTHQPPAFSATTATHGRAASLAVSETAANPNSNPVAASLPPVSNAPTSRISSPSDHDSTMSPANRYAANILREGLIGCYLVALLLFLLFAACRLRRHSLAACRRRRAEPTEVDGE